MRRLFQLLMPALAALVVGLFVLIFSFVAFDAFEVRGGLFVLGLYMLCTAAALAVVGALCLDTTYRPATAARAKKRGGMLDIARQPDRLARAYVQMYTIPFLPIALLTFGTGILVSTMLWGIVNEKLAAPVYIPEIIMAGWLVLMSLGMAAWRSRPAAFGCVAGIALAALATYTVDLYSTPELAIWGSGLVILTILILTVGALFRRRSAHRVEPA
jgi:hypothetical protein